MQVSTAPTLLKEPHHYRDAKATVACVLDECPENGVGLDDVAKQMRVIIFEYCDGDGSVNKFRRKRRRFYVSHDRAYQTHIFCKRSLMLDIAGTELRSRNWNSEIRYCPGLLIRALFQKP